MLFKKKTYLAACSLLALSVSCVYADDRSTELSAVEKNMQALTHKMEAMQREMTSLKQKLATQKVKANSLRITEESLAATQAEPKDIPFAERRFNVPNTDLGMPVFIDPFMGGVFNQYDQSNLMINASDVNRDVFVLKREKKVDDDLKSKNLKVPDQPILSFSGEVEGLTQVGRDYKKHFDSDIALENAQLNSLITGSPWVRAYMIFAYDGASDSTTNIGRKASSRVYVRNGFLTIGNFQVSPFYGSIGQMFLPFGRFNSSMIDNPMINTIGETIARTVVVGFEQQTPSHFYGSAYLAQGDARTDSTGKVNQWGGDFGYLYKAGALSSQLGVSYIANLADALGQQNTGGSNFTGFAANENLDHRVPGLDIYSNWGYQSYGFILEYTGATTAYSNNDLGFNGHGASPAAVYAEGNYSFKIKDHDSSVALSYGHSWQALALNLPRQRWMASLNSEIFRNLVLSFELRHDTNYGVSDTATGQNTATLSNTDTLGRNSDTLLTQFKFYF